MTNLLKCLICGAKDYKMLGKHLSSRHGLTSQEYEDRFHGSSIIPELSKIKSKQVSLVPSDHEFKFELERFNDHPVFGSRTKRSEVRELLEALPGVRYGLSCTETCRIPKLELASE